MRQGSPTVLQNFRQSISPLRNGSGTKKSTKPFLQTAPLWPMAALLVVVILCNVSVHDGSSRSSWVARYAAELMPRSPEAILLRSLPESHPRNQAVKWKKSRPPCLVVYHIPKTGGTTLEHYLRKLGQALQWDYNNWDDFARKYPGRGPFLTKSGRKWDVRNRIIHEGHLTPHFEKVTFTHTCAKLTVMRDPLERVISAFYFHKRDSHSLAEWENCLHTSCWLDFEYRNDMTRRFAGRTRWWNSLDRRGYLDDYRNGGLDNEMLINVTEDDLEATKERLRTLDAVCFLTNLKPCVDQFVRNAFGLDEVAWPSENLNKARRSKRDVTGELRVEISEANQLDIRLYEWASKTFHFENVSSEPETLEIPNA
jgi:Sulfotransferase family